MKSIFMTLWDGFSTEDNKIIILGATNRPRDVDAAFLRRMPAKYFIDLPVYFFICCLNVKLA